MMDKKRKNQKQTLWLMLIIIMLMVMGKVVYPRLASLSDGMNTEDGTAAKTGDETTEVLVDLSGCQAGDVLQEKQISGEHLEDYFTYQDIDETIYQRMQGKSYQENEQIALEDLCYVKVLHYNFSHEIQVGELVVNRQIAEDCTDIFLELFQQEYEINSMYLIDRYYLSGEDAGETADYNSINNNNTSCFNYRQVADTSVLSAHAYGLAIDINPLENPSMVQNADGSYSNKYLNLEDYTDRSSGKAHMISHEDVCYQIFAKYGFTWGGDWESNPDYQHFEKSPN